MTAVTFQFPKSKTESLIFFFILHHVQIKKSWLCPKYISRIENLTTSTATTLEPLFLPWVIKSPQLVSLHLPLTPISISHRGLSDPFKVKSNLITLCSKTPCGSSMLLSVKAKCLTVFYQPCTLCCPPTATYPLWPYLLLSSWLAAPATLTHWHCKNLPGMCVPQGLCTGCSLSL